MLPETILLCVTLLLLLCLLCWPPARRCNRPFTNRAGY